MYRAEDLNIIEFCEAFDGETGEIVRIARVIGEDGKIYGIDARLIIGGEKEKEGI